ncbi:triosephosphate isomerase [Candidatus Micrarchaeota archaeon]|nr:triosephosphate isomerase [Candidatus Micrarchaeota archaeon]
MAFVVLNLKTYVESTGQNALFLLEAAATARTNHSLVFCPSPLDASLVARSRTGGQPLLFGQYADANSSGAFTGSAPLDQFKKLGFEGTLLNHSEKKIPHPQIQKTVEAAKKLGLKALVCADSVAEAKKVAAFRPWAVAIEPPELIGSGVSVSSVQPELVRDGVSAVKAVDGSVKAFVGAGVSNRSDFVTSLQLGAEGVLLASAFAKAKDPEKWLKDFLG